MQPIASKPRSRSSAQARPASPPPTTCKSADSSRSTASSSSMPRKTPAAPGNTAGPPLTLSTANRIHDLPGMHFSEVTTEKQVKATEAVPKYFAEYEKRFELPVYRPVRAQVVCDRGDRLRIETDVFDLSALGIINATGTWTKPFIPAYPGAEQFKGRQLHTRDYRTADEFIGQHVVIVGGGISAIQLLDEIPRVTSTTWVTRRPTEFREGPFDENAGRPAVAIRRKPCATRTGAGSCYSRPPASSASPARTTTLPTQIP